MNDTASREEFLSPRVRRYKTVVILALDGKKVRVQSMTALERGRYEAKFIDRKKGGSRMEMVRQARELLVIETAVDEQGNRMFGPNDLKALNGVDVAILEPIVEAAKELNSISDDDLDDLAGNSETTPEDDSPSS